MKFKRELLTKKYWKEFKLIAIDECKMKDSNNPSLIKGKEYDIILKESDSKSFAIMDDDLVSELHWFDWYDLEEFFTIIKRDSKF
jgi:hypothetical protein